MAWVWVIRDSSDKGVPLVGCKAKILVDENGYTWALTSCGETVSDRGHFEDTIRAAEVHVDQCERPSA